MKMYWGVLSSVITLNVVFGSPGGAPSGACDSMDPNHSSTAQSGAAPYTITASNHAYRCGQSITVTLTATSSNFKGFLCQARTDVASYSSTVGTLAQTGSVTMKQNCGTGNALTHSESSDKTSAEFTWTPSADHGSVQIVCTIVQAKTTYWVKETSVALTYAGDCNRGAHTLAAPIGILVLTGLAYCFV